MTFSLLPIVCINKISIPGACSFNIILMGHYNKINCIKKNNNKLLSKVETGGKFFGDLSVDIAKPENVGEGITLSFLICLVRI